jgi:hypothetical protein
MEAEPASETLYSIKIKTMDKVQRKKIPSLRYNKCMQLDTIGLKPHYEQFLT